MTQALRLGIAGLGTVGVGVVKIVRRLADLLHARTGRRIEITAVSARDANKDRGVNLSDYAWETDPVALAKREDIDVFVELMGGENGPAKASVEAALNSGKDVVTANKALLAIHGQELAELAEAAGRVIRFEAAVAGGIPVIKAVREGLAANKIEWVAGIINGTGNYILTEMKKPGADFSQVLKVAQELGYAEADPTFDVEGIDAAHKLTILASIAFGIELQFNKVYTEGISKITADDIRFAQQLGYQIKHLGVASRADNGRSNLCHTTEPLIVCLVENKR